MKLEIKETRTVPSESLTRKEMRASIEVYPDCDEVQFVKWRGREWMRLLIVTERPLDHKTRKDEIRYREAKVRMFRDMARRELVKIRRLKRKPYLRRIAHKRRVARAVGIVIPPLPVEERARK